jgi:NAD dependent epimerase/dehydratase family enzyme
LIRRSDFSLNQDTFNEKLLTSDVIINLAGEPILRRWTKKNRKLIYDSRIQTTRKIAGFLNHNTNKERMFINISAIGLYNTDRINKESAYSLSTGFK